MQIGEKLKHYRKIRNFTQDELAYNAGINEKYYGKIERNESIPTISILEKICKALNVEIYELFFLDFANMSKQVFNSNIFKSIRELFNEGIDIHLNRDILFKNCESSIWYNGYIGSMCFDEFEMKVYAVGNIRGKLFLNYLEVLDLNDEAIANELIKYIDNDGELYKLIEFMPYDEEIIKEKNGNVLFLTETNWLVGKFINNNIDETVRDDIIFDTDNIFDCIINKDFFINEIFE